MATRGLGKGLDTLIPAGLNEGNSKKKEKEVETPDKYVKITKVEPNREQPRKIFNEDALQELSESIKQHGIIQPILVQDRKDHYEIIAGERRWRAAMLAGLKEVPVIIRNYSEQKIFEISLIENLQRADLNPIEEALGYKKLLEEYNLKQDEVATRMSKSRAAITNSIRLLKLSNDVQQMVESEMISPGHARALLAIEDKDQQYIMAQKVFDEKLSVRDIEKYVKELNKPKKEKKKAAIELDFIYRDIEEKLKIVLGTKVQIQAKSDDKGKIEIDYFSREDLERLVEILSTVSK